MECTRAYPTAVEAVKGCSTAQPLLLTTSLPPSLALAVLARCGLTPHPERLQLLSATSWSGSVAQAVSMAAARSTQLQLVTGSLAQLEQLAEGRVSWQGVQGGAGGAAGASGGAKGASEVAGKKGGQRGDGDRVEAARGGGVGRRGQGSGVGLGAGRAGSAGRRMDGGRDVGCGTDGMASVFGRQGSGRGAQVAVVGTAAGGLPRGEQFVEDGGSLPGRTGQLGASLDRQAAGRCGTQVQVRVVAQEAAQPVANATAPRASDGGNGNGTASTTARAAAGTGKGGTGRAGDPWAALAVVHLAEWSCANVSFRARALSHGPRAALLSEQQLAEVLRVMHLDVVMDGVAWR